MLFAIAYFKVLGRNLYLSHFYEDARQMLLEFEKWLRKINVSAAESLLEAVGEILTLHRIKVPPLLRKTLHSTNPIESMFSTVRYCEVNLKRIHNSAMSQRWLAAVLLHCEKGFRRVKGYEDITTVIENIDNELHDKLIIRRQLRNLGKMGATKNSTKNLRPLHN